MRNSSKECSIIVLSAALGGGEPVAGLHIVMQNHVSVDGGWKRGEVGVVVDLGGHWPTDPQLKAPPPPPPPDHQTFHFLICLGQVSFLSAVNLQHHPPIFIPFTVCFSFTSDSASLEWIYTCAQHCCAHMTNNGPLCLLSAAFFSLKHDECLVDLHIIMHLLCNSALSLH